MRHTKEPWQYESNENTMFLPVIKNEERTIFALNNLVNEEDAKRIIACVNACGKAGLTNEQLESGYIQDLINERDQSIKLVKEMLARLENTLGEYKHEAL